MSTAALNDLRWDGSRGHYEVYYLTFTDRGSGVGCWIRYTMVAPLHGEATASLWFLAMDPGDQARPTFARKATFPVDCLVASTVPFRLRIGEASLSDTGMAGAFEDVAWELTWSPGRGYEHVHPLLRRFASTVLVLPQADVEVRGWIEFGGRRLELRGARGGQAHLWGSKHASCWAWVHAGDLETLGGEPVPDAFVDGVSVIVPRLGREVGPSTPFVGRIAGRDFSSRSALRVLTNDSTFALTGWRFEVVGGEQKLVGEVDADRRRLAGVTYHDPDGELAYCYNSETATMRLHVYERARRVGGWEHSTTLLAPGRAHFEYAQREPVPGVELLLPG
jgi:hypothetical protein